jgi:uncharacterized protein
LKLRSSLLWVGLTGSVALATAQQEPAARHAQQGLGFDCSKARSKIDKSICADPQLSALDRKNADLFALAQSQGNDERDVKKEQRRWLRTRDDCEDTTCVKKSYEQRIKELATYTGFLPAPLLRTLCARFETPETRAETLERKAGAEDINNDGRPEIATQCSGGTANVPCASYVDENDRPIHVQPQGFALDTYSPLGRSAFRYDDHTFVYYSRDAGLAEPSYVSYITPTNRELRVCDFDTNIGSAVIEGGGEVCAAVESGERIEAVDLTSIVNRQTNAFDRPDTFAQSVGNVDIDNDGLDEALIELSYESGSGQGCTFNYFELMAEDRKSLLNNSNSIPVRELQGLPSEGYRGRNCGDIDNRLFKVDDKVYYETNVTNNPIIPHEVRVLEGTAVATLCTFERQVTTRVRTVFGE